jgi:hypothetical protein
MFRRGFARSVLGAAVASRLKAAPARKPQIVLRSALQIVNIGDIGHTPGVLALLEKHIPEAEVILQADLMLHGSASAISEDRASWQSSPHAKRAAQIPISLNHLSRLTHAARHSFSIQPFQ